MSSSSTISENFISICYPKYTLWVTKVEKLDVWTMHVFSNPVTYINKCDEYSVVTALEFYP